MAVSIASEGTQTATVGTEHTLYTTSTAGVYALAVDVTNLSGTETVELRAKSKVKSSSSAIELQVATFAAGATSPGVISIPYPLPSGVTFTLKQVGGTGRNFDWGAWAL